MTAQPFEKPNLGMAPDLFTSMAKEQARVGVLQEQLLGIAKGTFPNYEMLLDHLADSGVPVLYDLPEVQMTMILKLLGLEAGFIAPTSEHYHHLVQFFKKHLKGSTDEDFSQGLILLLKTDKHYAALFHAFYHWCAFHAGLPGYDSVGRKLYYAFNHKHQSQLNPKFLNNLSAEQTDALKMAIRRDKEALQFMRKLMHEVIVPGNNSKLIEGGTARA